jgi:hypothetical protein
MTVLIPFVGLLVGGESFSLEKLIRLTSIVFIYGVCHVSGRRNLVILRPFLLWAYLLEENPFHWRS